MKIEIHCNIDKRQCPKTAQGEMDIIAVKPFYELTSSMTARPVSFPRLMILAFASSATKSIIHAKGVEPHKLKEKNLMPMQSDKFNSDPIVTATQYEPPERSGEQMDGSNVVKQSDEVSENDWRGYLILPDEYSPYSNKVLACLQIL